MNLTWSKPVNYGGKGGYIWPNYDGVYVIAKESNDKLKAVYVGQGKIKERMEAHHDWKNEPNECLKDIMKNRDKHTKVFHAEVNDDESRNNAEYTLFNYFGGKELLCNEKDPPLGKLVYTLNFPFEKIKSNY